jgi:hypothetical protein
MTAPVRRINLAGAVGDLARRVRILEATPCGDELPRNVGELGFTIGTNQATTHTLTVTYQDVLTGDGIMVSAQAPSLPVALGTQGFPISCTDSAGNTYSILVQRDFQAAVTGVNTGVYTVVFFCQSSIAPLLEGVDTITVTWDNPVYDRSVYGWLVRHNGGAAVPTLLAATASNDAAVFASNQVTLTSPGFTPARDNSLEFGWFLVAYTGGSISFGGVGGYTGFFQAQFRGVSGSKQNYLMNVQTSGADDYLQVGAVPQNEITLGLLPGGVAVGSFNGMGQQYSAFTPRWKGALMWLMD